MQIKLDINSVAVKQLESAIWMYAYDFDEVAVHTVASAALELYSDRLGLSTFKSDTEKHIKPEKIKDFHSLWNRPYNFFKHGSHKHKPLDELVYNPDSVEIIIYLAAEANLAGEVKFRLNCSQVYRHFYLIKYPELFNTTYYKDVIEKRMTELGIDKETITSKETLRLWLDLAGHTFVNGTKTPFKPVAKNN